jgi:Ni/Fe-hydrogenase b-type cytochrome subunit
VTPEQEQFYTLYERMWHWLQAIAMLLLMLTGLVIHYPSAVGVVPFDLAVSIHNVLGFLLVANALFGLFYYVTTGTIRQHIPEPRDFLSLSARQATYYLRGMFRGESHPLAKTSERRLNPLQQVTYLSILNVLLPLQVVTGLLMWSGQLWPASISALGRLATLAMIHTAGAWLFAAFLIVHVYLTTTGHTPLAHLRAMIFGYEERPVPAVVEVRSSDCESSQDLT